MEESKNGVIQCSSARLRQGFSHASSNIFFTLLGGGRIIFIVNASLRPSAELTEKKAGSVAVSKERKKLAQSVVL